MGHNFNEIQFQCLIFSGCMIILTIYNFDGRAKRASEKIAYNFNGATISIFWEMTFYNNFNILTISMFDIFWMYDNFNVLQFQQAREARQRKNSIQFQHCNNFYFWEIIFYNNFNVLTISNFFIIVVPLRGG